MDKKVLENDACKRKVMTRKVINIAGSCYICLPKLFCYRHNIKAGDKLALMVGESLRVMPFDRED